MPETATIPDALRSINSSHFVYAFFGIAEPLAQMQHKILDLFERIRANEGPEHWRLRFDNYEISQTNLSRCINEGGKIPGYVEHPALNRSQGVVLYHELQKGEDGLIAPDGATNRKYLALPENIEPKGV